MNINKIIVTVASFLCFLPVFAQSAPPATPIDGGLTLLIIAGGAYGVKVIKDSKMQ